MKIDSSRVARRGAPGLPARSRGAVRSFARFAPPLLFAITAFKAGEARAQDEAPAPQADAPAQPPARPAPAAYAAPPESGGSGLGRTANNAIFFEFLGNGGVYSLNYERFFDDFGIRAGFSYISIEANSGSNKGRVSLTTFPIMGNYYLGSANHKLQLGAGVLLASFSGDASTDFGTDGSSGFGVAGTATVGYRYMPRKGGFNFGVGFTPLFGAGGFLPWGGLALGGVF